MRQGLGEVALAAKNFKIWPKNTSTAHITMGRQSKAIIWGFLRDNLRKIPMGHEGFKCHRDTV